MKTVTEIKEEINNLNSSADKLKLLTSLTEDEVTNIPSEELKFLSNIFIKCIHSEYLNEEV